MFLFFSFCHQKPIPAIPHDGPLQFEIFIFVYSMVALLLQYLHLYKSVWWLPHSYNAYAMVRKNIYHYQFLKYKKVL